MTGIQDRRTPGRHRDSTTTCSIRRRQSPKQYRRSIQRARPSRRYLFLPPLQTPPLRQLRTHGLRLLRQCPGEAGGRSASLLLALSPFGLFVVATQLQFACHPPLPLPLSPLRLPLTATQSSHLSSPPHHAPRVASALPPRPFPAPSLTTIPRCQHPHRIQALCLLTLVEQSLHRGGVGWGGKKRNRRQPSARLQHHSQSRQSAIQPVAARPPHSPLNPLSCRRLSASGAYIETPLWQ